MREGNSLDLSGLLRERSFVIMGKKIIFDTDIGCDCDDAAALAVALELMNAG